MISTTVANMTRTTVRARRRSTMAGAAVWAGRGRATRQGGGGVTKVRGFPASAYLGLVGMVDAAGCCSRAPVGGDDVVERYIGKRGGRQRLARTDGRRRRYAAGA